MANDTKYYVDPEDFHKEYEKSLEIDKPTTRLLSMCEKIARGMQRTFPFVNPQDTDALINYGVEEAWRKWKKYDKDRSMNIFAFFTTMITNDMKTHYKQIMKHKKNNVSLDAIFAGNKYK